MKAARVHAVLAGGVNDPRRLAAWAANPQALRDLGIDPASLDLQALRHFCGLALKVRHNGLRDLCPQTFRLLDVAGLEIELFAAYALAQAESGVEMAAGTEARAQALIDFIQRWHDPRQAPQLQLWDLARHELALWQLAQADAALPEPALAAPWVALAQPNAASVPHRRGAMRLLELHHDPLALVQALQPRWPDLAAFAVAEPPAPRALCYWRAPGVATVARVELDAFGHAVLQAADGKRCVADIAATLGLGRRVPARVLQLLAALRSAGLLVFAGHTAGAVQRAAAR